MTQIGDIYVPSHSVPYLMDDLGIEMEDYYLPQDGIMRGIDSAEYAWIANWRRDYICHFLKLRNDIILGHKGSNTAYRRLPLPRRSEAWW